MPNYKTLNNTGVKPPHDAPLWALTDNQGNRVSVFSIEPHDPDVFDPDRWVATWTATTPAGFVYAGCTDFHAWKQGGGVFINDERVLGDDAEQGRELRAVVLDALWFASVKQGVGV